MIIQASLGLLLQTTPYQLVESEPLYANKERFWHWERPIEQDTSLTYDPSEGSLVTRINNKSTMGLDRISRKESPRFPYATEKVSPQIPQINLISNQPQKRPHRRVPGFRAQRLRN